MTDGKRELARAYAERVRDAGAIADALTEVAAEVRRKVSHAGDDERAERIAATLDAEVAERLEAWARFVGKFVSTCERVGGIHGEVLLLRYARGLEWREIAKKLHYSERGTYHVHDAALSRLYEEIRDDDGA